MFVGHFGLGLAAKPAAKNVSLGTLFLAAQFVDLLWPTLLLLGLESVSIVPGATKLTPFEFTHYPISHSLVAVIGWSTLVGALVYLRRRTTRVALICAGLVSSHWFLDALVHQPDLPISPGGSARIGLGLWNAPVLAIGLELTLFAVGLALYLRATRALDRVGSMGFWSLIGFLGLVYVGNFLGPPPPNVSALAWVGHAQWLIVAWGYWIDRHRDLK